LLTTIKQLARGYMTYLIKKNFELKKKKKNLNQRHSEYEKIIKILLFIISE